MIAASLPRANGQLISYLGGGEALQVAKPHVAIAPPLGLVSEDALWRLQLLDGLEQLATQAICKLLAIRARASQQSGQGMLLQGAGVMNRV